MTSSVTDAAVDAAIAENTKIYLDGLAERAEALTPPPVSELVTVEWQTKFGDLNYWTNVIASNVPGHIACGRETRELVTRDQAEAREADLLRQLEIANRNRDAARENFLTMQTTAETLLRRAEAAEAKLAAQDQKPIGSYQIVNGKVASTTDCYPDGLPYPDGDLELYAAPQPDRSAVLEEAANVTRLIKCRCGNAFYPDDGCGCERESWSGPLDHEEIAAAIRALKEPSK